ncbi:F-box protein pof12 [Neolecta irregularis DAH-3]|uniref:F-box protein pof12 n=1 Tax=Neolecta irregularis (strain DAH-3) TaxID=1198029 RepID=A0A1U7LJX9_NEOID|nr:F-box protein pof12 [Neolecta irregularis DAH-3]|eukprot:OLL22938.1 F-box protein pof12 [Neolecta irregularis DAH-3]
MPKRQRSESPFSCKRAKFSFLILNLSDEIILHIFSYLSHKDLLASQLVSRRWNRIVDDNQLWRKLFFKTFRSSKVSTDWRNLFRITHNWQTASFHKTNIPSVSPIAGIKGGKIYSVDQQGITVSSISGIPEKFVKLNYGLPSCISISSAIYIGYKSGWWISLSSDLSLQQSEKEIEPVDRIVHDFGCTIIVTVSLHLSIYQSSRLTHSFSSLGVENPYALSLRKLRNEIVASILYTTALPVDYLLGIYELNITTGIARYTTSRTSISIPNQISYSHPYVLSSHKDNTLCLHLLHSSPLRLFFGDPQKWYGHTSGVTSAVVDRDRAISCARGGEVRLWEQGGSCVIVEGEEDVICLDETRVFLKGKGQICIWDFGI